MREAVLARLPETTVVIMAAAVADYTLKAPASRKMKRQGPLLLELEPTKDIVAEVAARKRTQIVIGFAAETENVLENARKKLVSKGLDAIVANDVSRSGIAIDSDRNAVTILSASELVEVPEAGKLEVAQRILDAVQRLHVERGVSAEAQGG
jgi:phosphopantothenoylcysteine decarboxylase/phosphopantothenate--cysteine ligase